MAEAADRDAMTVQERDDRLVCKAVIFDGDDTLWLTEALYDVAREAARAEVDAAGLDGAAWDEAQRRIDVANVARLGHQASRFPTSSVEALAEVARGGVEKALEDAVWTAAASVFEAVAPLRDHADTVLDCLVAQGFRLALLTKGDRQVQVHRIETSGLARRFDVIEIVEHKAAADFRRVAATLDVEVNEVVSVGNSIRSDVLPSLEAGLHALWLPAYVWDYERSHDGPTSAGSASSPISTRCSSCSPYPAQKASQGQPDGFEGAAEVVVIVLDEEVVTVDAEEGPSPWSSPKSATVGWVVVLELVTAGQADADGSCARAETADANASSLIWLHEPTERDRSSTEPVGDSE